MIILGQEHMEEYEYDEESDSEDEDAVAHSTNLDSQAR